LGVREEVQSPTFTVIAEYPAPSLGRDCWLVHVDLYRLDGGAAIATIGLDEVLDRDDAVVVIEWPDRAGHDVQRAQLTIRIDQRGDNRTISVTGARAVGIR
jgi:tRNA threonylcarbamoyladenosine biosynthesis protein TsaE